MFKKYLILCLFIASPALSHGPNEKKAPSAKSERLSEEKKLQVRRKNYVNFRTGTKHVGPAIAAVKKTSRTATTLHLELNEEWPQIPEEQEGQIQENPVQDALPVVKALPPSLESFIFRTNDQEVLLSAPSVKALNHLRRLKKLDVYKSTTGRSVFKDQATLREIERLKLKMLNLRSLITAPRPLLIKRLNLFKGIQALQCVGTEFQNFIALKKTLAPLPFLTSLVLSDVGASPYIKNWSIDDHNISFLSRILKRLTHLEITYSEFASVEKYLTNEGVVHLLQLAPQIQSLSLGNFHLAPLNLASFASHLARGGVLKRLSLAATVFTFVPQNNENIHDLFSRLESLSLTLTRPTDRPLQNLLGLFADLPLQGSILKNLRVTGVNEGFLGPEEFKGLSKLLRLPSLKHLALDSGSLKVFSHQDFDEYDDPQRPDKCYAFQSFEFLSGSEDHLSTFLRRISEKGEVRMFSIMPRLKISYSSPDLQNSIARGILSNPHLETLKLGRGTLDPQDAIDLFSKEGLKEIYLTRIEISGFSLESFDKDLIQLLRKAIMENQSLNHIYCKGADKTYSGIHFKGKDKMFVSLSMKEVLLQALGEQALLKKPSLKIEFED